MAEPLISTPLTMQQLKVLTMIAIDPEKATGHELAALLKVSVATMSGLVDRLVEHGMVARGEDPSDRRVRRLTVTPEGSATIRSLLSSAGTMPTPVLQRLAIEDLRALVQGILAFERAVGELADGERRLTGIPPEPESALSPPSALRSLLQRSSVAGLVDVFSVRGCELVDAVASGRVRMTVATG